MHFLEGKMNLLFFWLCSEAKPGRHTVILNVARGTFALVELKGSRQFIQELSFFQEVRLRLVRIVEVHEVYRFQAEVLLTGLKLMFKILWMHTMNPRGHITLFYLLFEKKFALVSLIFQNPRLTTPSSTSSFTSMA